MELVNEVLQMTLYYHMILFSKKTVHVAAHFGFGYSFLGILVLIMISNLVVTAVDSVKTARRTKRLAANKAAFMKRVEELKAEKADQEKEREIKKSTKRVEAAWAKRRGLFQRVYEQEAASKK